MLKKTLLGLVVLLALQIPARAQWAPTYTPITYVAVATFTVPGTGKDAIAFQNTDAGRDVTILKIEVSDVSNTAITGGIMQFWIMGATVTTAGGTSQTSFWDAKAANTTAPSYISFSTGPVNVVYEGKQGTSQLPLARPLIVNSDEAATANLWDTFQSISPAFSAELILPHGSNRAIVLRQMQLGASDFTAGVIMARIFYTVK